MRVIIRDASGLRHEGILLATGTNHLRITLQDHEDAVDIRFAEGQWTLDGEGPAELEALFTPGEEGEWKGLPTPFGNLGVNAASAS